jgi:hypothetical protein
MKYYTTGDLRFLAPNNRLYCSVAAPEERQQVDRLIGDEQALEELRAIGAYLGFPDCVLSEYVTIEIHGVSQTARIDALDGRLLEVAKMLDGIFRKHFRDRYDVSLFLRATQPNCASPRMPELEPPHHRTASSARQGGI